MLTTSLRMLAVVILRLVLVSAGMVLQWAVFHYFARVIAVLVPGLILAVSGTYGIGYVLDGFRWRGGPLVWRPAGIVQCGALRQDRAMEEER